MTVTQQRFSPMVSRQVMYETALEAYRVGICTVPIPLNGTKHPAFKWEIYQHQLPLLLDLRRWFLENDNGIALVTGVGDLELLDFDSHDVYFAWRRQMEKEGVGALAERMARGYLEQTPNGMHQWFRCRLVEGNQPLARIPRADGGKKAVIETRGKGGIGVAAPSAGRVHPSGKPYIVLRGHISTIQTITVPEREKAFSVARMFDACPPSREPSSLLSRQREGACNNEHLLPGRIFNGRASWQQVLAPFGWRYLYARGEEEYWTKNKHVHATINYRGSGLLYVFSTSTVFEPNCGYTKFAAYTLLQYGSISKDTFKLAARELAAQGYAR